MKLFVADGKLIIVTVDASKFVVTPCRGHRCHIKPATEVHYPKLLESLL